MTDKLTIDRSDIEAVRNTLSSNANGRAAVIKWAESILTAPVVTDPKDGHSISAYRTGCLKRAEITPASFSDLVSDGGLDPRNGSDLVQTEQQLENGDSREHPRGALQPAANAQMTDTITLAIADIEALHDSLANQHNPIAALRWAESVLGSVVKGVSKAGSAMQTHRPGGLQVVCYASSANLNTLCQRGMTTVSLGAPTVPCRPLTFADDAQAQIDALVAENVALLGKLTGRHALTGATYDALVKQRDALLQELAGRSA